jgi:hypothetical protein
MKTRIIFLALEIKDGSDGIVEMRDALRSYEAALIMAEGQLPIDISWGDKTSNSYRLTAYGREVNSIQ